MKIQPKIALISVLIVLSLAACSQDASDDSASANSQYSRVTVDDETCVRDSETGLLWEGKTDRGGLHDYRSTYSWYSPNEVNGELDYRGTENAGKCNGSNCDTWHYVQAVNEVGYCGHKLDRCGYGRS